MDTKMMIKTPEKLKEQAKEKAESMGLSLSAYVRLVLTQDLKKK